MKIKEVSKDKKKEIRLITAALPYINNIPHLGHIVGSHLPADIFARYCRLKGYETLFVGGTDENGSASEIAAEEVGEDINIFSQKLHEEHKKIYKWFNISYDNFSRTSNLIHYRTTQKFFKKIYKNGFIKEGTMEVFYSPKEKRYLPDRYIKGICPKCGYEDANGDQCEKCTSLLDATQLLQPRSILSGERVEIRTVKHLFFRLDQLSEKLNDWLKTKNFWRPQVKKIALGWIKEGLKERCITRDLKHGIRVPLKEYKDKVFYVWFDAPIGYISATKEVLPTKWKNFWQDTNAKVYHFLGKDNIPFHTIFWPALLMAHGDFNLPYHVEGLQYLTYEGEKFSKSKKTGVFCEKLPESGVEADIFRAYLILIIPDSKDAEFKWSDFQLKINSDIIGNYGNFINRTLSFIYYKLGGKLQKIRQEDFTDSDKKLISIIKEKTKKINEYLERVYLKKAFLEILSLSSSGNKYFNENEPWHLINKNISRTNNILYLCAHLCRALAILTYPYLPTTANKIWYQLNLGDDIAEKEGVWETINDIDILDNHTFNRPHILFNKLDNNTISKLKELTLKPTDLKDYF